MSDPDAEEGSPAYLPMNIWQVITNRIKKPFSLRGKILRLKDELKLERNLAISERQWRASIERDLEAAEATIEALKAQTHDPLAEAKKLLRVIDEILVPIYVRSGEINSYELRCWKDDLMQFKRRNQ